MKLQRNTRDRGIWSPVQVAEVTVSNRWRRGTTNICKRDSELIVAFSRSGDAVIGQF